jgi:hypothetical protein
LSLEFERCFLGNQSTSKYAASAFEYHLFVAPEFLLTPTATGVELARPFYETNGND